MFSLTRRVGFQSAKGRHLAAFSLEAGQETDRDPDAGHALTARREMIRLRVRRRFDLRIPPPQ